MRRAAEIERPLDARAWVRDLRDLVQARMLAGSPPGTEAAVLVAVLAEMVAAEPGKIDQAAAAAVVHRMLDERIRLVADALLQSVPDYAAEAVAAVGLQS
jgi:hypothetical protein